MSDRVTVAQLKQAILNLQPLMGAGKSKKNTIVAKAPSKAELVVLASTPHDGSSAPVPKRRLAAPLAPSEDAAAEPKSGGLLKKLFGFGKTKK